MDERTIFFSHPLVQTCLGRSLWQRDEASAMLTSYDYTKDAAQRAGYPSYAQTVRRLVHSSYPSLLAISEMVEGKRAGTALAISFGLMWRRPYGAFDHLDIQRVTDDLVIALIGSDEKSPVGAFQVVACWSPKAFAREAAQVVHAGMDAFTPGLFAWTTLTRHVIFWIVKAYVFVCMLTLIRAGISGRTDPLEIGNYIILQHGLPRLLSCIDGASLNAVLFFS